MRASPLVLALGVGAVALAAAAAGASTGKTALRVSYWESGAAGPPDETWSLRCDPPGGTLPRPARACAKLARGGSKLFAPTPSGVACTEIYGGPERARVVGLVRGRRVWVTVTRRDGCEIERWNRLAPWLVPKGGVPT